MMKRHFFFPIAALALSIALASTAARAEWNEPDVVPGAALELEGLSLRAVEAVVDHVDALERLMSHGGEILEVGALHGYEGAHYEVLVGDCTIDSARVCAAKALLTIDRGHDLTTGAYDRAEVTQVTDSHHVLGELRNTTVRLIQALAHVTEDVRRFAGHGNRLTLASTQFIQPKYSRFAIQNTHCGALPHGGCLGGARLSILATTSYESGVPKTRYTSELILIK